MMKKITRSPMKETTKTKYSIFQVTPQSSPMLKKEPVARFVSKNSAWAFFNIPNSQTFLKNHRAAAIIPEIIAQVIIGK